MSDTELEFERVHFLSYHVFEIIETKEANERVFESLRKKFGCATL